MSKIGFGFFFKAYFIRSDRPTIMQSIIIALKSNDGAVLTVDTPTSALSPIVTAVPIISATTQGLTPPKNAVTPLFFIKAFAIEAIIKIITNIYTMINRNK